MLRNRTDFLEAVESGEPLEWEDNIGGQAHAAHAAGQTRWNGDRWVLTHEGERLLRTFQRRRAVLKARQDN